MEMNYNQAIDKINSLEERLDILLLTLNSTDSKPVYFEKLKRYKDHALIRQRRRDEENEIKSEYFELKTRIAQLETDYPNLVK